MQRGLQISRDLGLLLGFHFVEAIAKASLAISSIKARLSSKWKRTQIQKDMHNGNAKIKKIKNAKNINLSEEVNP